MITADVYQYDSKKALAWERAYSHPNYTLSLMIEAETPEELIEKLAQKLEVSVTINRKTINECGAV